MNAPRTERRQLVCARAEDLLTADEVQALVDHALPFARPVQMFGSSSFRPRYLPRSWPTRGERRRRRMLRRLARAVLFPILVLVALLRWLASPSFLD